MATGLAGQSSGFTFRRLGVSTMNQWRNDLTRALNSYYASEATTQAVVSMYSAIRTTARALAEVNDEETRSGQAQMLIDLTFGLDTNPLMMNYRQQIWPIFQAAVNAYLSSMGYMEKAADNQNQREQIDLRTKAIATKTMIHEVALMALMCEQGGPAYLSKATQMRDDLMAIEDKING